ncbi:hypothetical protein [Mesorhizobium sp. ES1-3]|uniref:hypothetical protein n=1 Tax=Mesorhizobium sp. ES1-3 TaxID=2876628 RepID=UPI001CCC540E|nr:hypothetical protein [Mesorhizobium sp. ES1-3]MBZ9669258.1 hypothetical protein [Mesorhizobium sp. ES1-3]
MKVGRLVVIFSALYLSLFGSTSAQTLFTLSVVSKGTFEFDRSYPGGDITKRPFNFHRMFGLPPNGETINYFVFKPSDDVFMAMNSMGRDSLFSTIEPCSFGVNKVLADRAQTIGGEIRSVFGRTDLLPYLKRRELIQSDGYIYVAIDSNLRNYVRNGSEFGSEWVPMAVQKKQVCLYIGVGRMGYRAFASQPINLSRLANFVFVD